MRWHDMVLINDESCDETRFLRFSIGSLQSKLIPGSQDHLSAKKFRALIETEKIGICLAGENSAILRSMTCLRSHLAWGHIEIRTDDRIDAQAIM